MPGDDILYDDISFPESELSFSSELVLALRYYIQDYDPDNYTYTDAQLETFLSVAAIQVINDIPTFGDTYTVVINPASISPDPTDDTSDGFAMLVVYRAACVIARGESKKTAAAGGWKIVDDRSTIDGTQAVKGAIDLAKNYCQAYTDALTAYEKGASQGQGSAILGPYASANSSRAWWPSNWYPRT